MFLSNNVVDFLPCIIIRSKPIVIDGSHGPMALVKIRTIWFLRPTGSSS